MRLEKKTREKLYKAKGKPVMISWPLDDAPRKGQRHAVYGDSGEKIFSIRIEGVRWAQRSALVVIDNDPIRLLHGMADEPEKVSEAYEDLLCFEAAARNAIRQGEQQQRARSQEAASKSHKGKLSAEFAARQKTRLEQVV